MAEENDKATGRGLLWLWLLSMAWLVIEVLRGTYADDELLRETYVSATGIWGMWFLIASFAVSPLIRKLKLSRLARFRRELGLIGFVYVVVHIVFYIVSVGLFPHYMGIIVRRPYLQAGLAATIAVTPLALTSTKHAIQKLGPILWRRVHYLVYPTLILTILHENLYRHGHIIERGAHFVVVAVLIGERIVVRLRKN